MTILISEQSPGNRETLILENPAESAFRTVVHRNPDAILVIDAIGTVQYANPAAARFFRRPTEVLRGSQFGYPVYGGEKVEIEVLPRPDPPVHAELRVTEIEWGGEIAFLANIRDVTDRKRIEEDLRRSLDEKESLLKEIHHRVKNNMQVISSLLNLQATTVSDESGLLMLRESQQRIRAMALVHEQLYRSSNLARIEMNEYLRVLAGHLARTYGVPGVELRVTGTGGSLAVDTAIPCGLIVNELVTNAFKYAFPGERGGFVEIEFREDSGGYVLAVGDDGVGMPSHIDLTNASTLGLQLVSTLADQINGTIDVKREAGTSILLHFRESTK
jgi:two-component sensor histidine kinase